MNDNDKDNTVRILNNIAEEFLNLYETTHVSNYKHDYNNFTEIAIDIQQLNTKK